MEQTRGLTRFLGINIKNVSLFSTECSLKADLRIMFCEIPSPKNSLRQVLMVRPAPGSLEGAWKLPGSSSSFTSCPVDYSGKNLYESKASTILQQQSRSLVRTPCWQRHNTSTACHQFYGAVIITPRREKGRLWWMCISNRPRHHDIILNLSDDGPIWLLCLTLKTQDQNHTATHCRETETFRLTTTVFVTFIPHLLLFSIFFYLVS